MWTFQKLLDLKAEYEYFGPITPTEVQWLEAQPESVRTRWMHSIYGSTVASYARKQYAKLRQKHV